jgi:protein SCO1
VAAAITVALTMLADSEAPRATSPPPSVAVAATAAIPGMTGRFALETAAGRRMTQASFPGKWLVIYFGYTQCPDACPTALNAMAAALGALGPLAARIQPLFITVDPQRDTQAIVGDYVKAFDPRIIGLRGSDEETEAAAKAFHAYYAVRQLGHGEYAIDHSSFIYVVDPGGRVIELLTGNLPGRAMAAALRQLLQ